MRWTRPATYDGATVAHAGSRPENHTKSDKHFDLEAAEQVAALDAALRALGDRERAVREKAYLKSELLHYGVKVPTVDRTARQFLRERVAPEHEATAALVVGLWATGVHELRTAAIDALAERLPLLTPDDLPLLERLLREARTWALVDGLAPYVVGPLVARFPGLEAELRRWAADPDFWLRRAALLAYLLPMRRAEPVFDKFTAIADPMLEDREFFIRKAIGWVLRERGRKRPDEVYAWLAPRRGRASRLTLREASKYLGAEQREELLGPTNRAAPRAER